VGGQQPGSRFIHLTPASAPISAAQKHFGAQSAVTQAAHTLQSVVAQHICLHVAGAVPPTVQRWKAHWVSPRQVCVSPQHAPTMHWLHGVPPGSSVQLPESMGGVPQWPPVHARPTQHCGELEQFEPGGRQVPVPQWPPSQALEQHSPVVAQGKPSSLQMGAPQVPAEQTWLQQSLG